MTTVDGNQAEPNKPYSWVRAMKVFGVVLLALLVGLGAAIPIVREVLPRFDMFWAISLGVGCGLAAAVVAGIGVAAGLLALGWL
ncbi:hypothetical protein [Nocardia salmonicida]|uniref:hypothetical protein n=1 Tax=Nocardia salmonicida TaxID=53431 RepID=UPI0033EC59B1